MMVKRGKVESKDTKDEIKSCTEGAELCPYECARNLIKEAIECLTKVSDEIDAQEAIANLSVIFFDLQR